MSLSVSNQQTGLQDIPGGLASSGAATGTAAQPNSLSQAALRTPTGFSDSMLKSMNPCGNVSCTCPSDTGATAGQPDSAAAAPSDQ